jgi:CxxC motif-containing protein (DUF1111 family)
MLPRHNGSYQFADPAMARAGEALFKHEWRPNDPLCAGGDGLGPVFNATSCVACHHLAGPGGAGGLQHNVTTFTVRAAQVVRFDEELADEDPENPVVREGVVHAYGIGLQETLKDIHPGLPAIPPPPLEKLLPTQRLDIPRFVHISQRNTPALFGARLIDELPEAVILAGAKAQERRWKGRAVSNAQMFPLPRALRLADGRVGRFGWKAQTASLSEFVRAACANELGLANPGHPQPRPLGQPDYPQRGLDLTAEQCDQITAFVASLPRPVERLPDSAAERDAAEAGKELFGSASVGCADCHTPDLGSVRGIYSDLLLHRMADGLGAGGSYGEQSPAGSEGPLPSEWRTPPLWGVADSAPYMHDGRAATLEEAIRLHGGQGGDAASRFARLPGDDQARLVAFLKTLRAP